MSDEGARSAVKETIRDPVQTGYYHGGGDSGGGGNMRIFASSYVYGHFDVHMSMFDKCMRFMIDYTHQIMIGRPQSSHR